MEEKGLDYEISEKYCHELNEIANKMQQLENGRIYELSGATMDGNLATNITQLREMFAKLLSKIQNGDESIQEIFASYMK